MYTQAELQRSQGRLFFRYMSFFCMVAYFLELEGMAALLPSQGRAGRLACGMP